MEKREMEKQKPGMLVSIVALAIILAAITASIKLNFGTQMSVFSGAVASVIIAMALKTKWSDIQKDTMENMADYGPVLMILTFVGTLVGVWMIGGTLPTLISYGLALISPKIIVPLTFLLCAITSVFTGTSYGSIATMGLALFGIGINIGIPASLMAGAVVSGAYFGDKMSPMSDTTNLAPALAGTDLYSHIGSMFYTTIPATVVVLILYLILGMKYAGTNYDTATVTLMQETLQANYNISAVCLIPIIMVLVLSAIKVPSILAMGSSAVVSMILAAITQHAPLSAIMNSALNGYTSDTGVAMIDTILTRGGIHSMIGVMSIMFFSAIMAGALKASGILDTLVQVVLKAARSVTSLIVTTLVFGWAVVALTGNQMMGIIIPGKTMGDAYDKLDVHRKVLSRSLEDSATIGSVIIPWSSGYAYTIGVLGVGIGFIPFAFLCYIVPVFSIICAVTGFGIWNSKGEPRRKKS